jgi:hypothetical protein
MIPRGRLFYLGQERFDRNVMLKSEHRRLEATPGEGFPGLFVQPLIGDGVHDEPSSSSGTSA